MTLLNTSTMKLGAILFSLLFVVFGYSTIAHAATEQIQSFTSSVNIQQNGTLYVTENIVYDFGSNQKHGIFRDIPLTAGNGPELTAKVLSVKNEAGLSYPFTSTTSSSTIHIRIGDPNIFVAGVKTYVIQYQIENAIRVFPDHHELYWNVTGNGWTVPITYARSIIMWPDTTPATANMTCFTGATGSTNYNCDFAQNKNTISFSTTQSLNPSEGLTIVVGLPLGILTPVIHEIPKTSHAFNFLIILFPLILLVLAITIIRRRIRLKAKPRPAIPKQLKGLPIITQYNPPDELAPIEVGTLLDRRVDITDISSVILDLAVRGYIKIHYTVQVIKFWPDKKDFELIKLKDGSDLVHPADKILFDMLFRNRENVRLSELQTEKNAFQETVKAIRKATEAHMEERGYFDAEANKKAKRLTKYLGVMAVAFIILVQVSPMLINISHSLFFEILAIALGAISLVTTVVLMAAVGNLLHQLTAKGLSALTHILGFQEFLRMTETDKLRLLNAPSLQPETFEKFLPYAMVFGVEKEWAKTFEGIYVNAPTWYEDSTMTQWNSHSLAMNLVLFNSSFDQVFEITSPKSSSGFGGGFSGGGSGGGGGGSW